MMNVRGRSIGRDRGRRRETFRTTSSSIPSVRFGVSQTGARTGTGRKTGIVFHTWRGARTEIGGKNRDKDCNRHMDSDSEKYKSRDTGRWRAKARGRGRGRAATRARDETSADTGLRTRSRAGVRARVEAWPGRAPRPRPQRGAEWTGSWRGRGL